MAKNCLLMLVLVAMCSCSPNNPEPEKEHPYDKTKSQNKGLGLLPGLTNLGGSCFANASINVMLSSSEIQKILLTTLTKLPGQSQAQYDARIGLQTSLKNLYQARKQLKSDVTTELNAYFDAFEAARLSINGSELVGGKDKLRKDQGDARDFIEDNLDMLGYGHNPQVAFIYHVFTADNEIRVMPLPEPIIGLTIAGLPNTQYGIEDLYKFWGAAELRAGPDQVVNKANVLADSNRFHVINDPPKSSLFFAVYRFFFDQTDKTSKRLSTRVRPDMALTIKSSSKANPALGFSHQYILKAIAVHHGALGGGHYYAYVYNYIEKRWEKYNDSQVSVVPEAAVLKDADSGYIYLYEQEKLTP
jgi:ubiquitin C-terminal hydrolase